MSDKFKPGDRVRILVPRSVENSERFSMGDITTVQEDDVNTGPDEVLVGEGYYYRDNEIELVDQEAFREEWNQVLQAKYDKLAGLPERFGSGGCVVETLPIFETRVVNPTTGGAKGSKPARFSLLPWDVLSKLAEHYGKGAQKYTRYGECNCANVGAIPTHGECAEAVTTNGSNSETLRTPSGNENSRQSGNASTTTSQNPRNPITAATPMGSLKTSTTFTSQSRAGSAVLHPNTLTTTTAVTQTARDVGTVFEGHFATDVTSDSVTSKGGSQRTGKKHLPGCPALTIVSQGDHNWRKGYDWSLSIDALGRHLAAFIEGEDIDPETGSHHMLAVMFHAAALVYFTEAFPELDDRRKSAAS